MKTHTLLALAAALMVPAAALANHEEDDYRSKWTPQGQENAPAFHQHDASCHHDSTPPMPQPPRYQRGHYELRPISSWVDGYYDRVWVPEKCVQRERGRGHHWGRPHRMICQPAHYEQQWIPGRYVTAQQWVWVPHYG